MAYIGADSVKAIRVALKAEFPEIKFSVTLDNHSSVNISIMESPYNLINEHTADEADIKFGYSSINHYYPERYAHEALYQRIWDIVKIAPFNAASTKAVPEPANGSNILLLFEIFEYLNDHSGI